LARIGRITALIGLRFSACYRTGQRPDIVFVELDKRTTLEAARQHHGAVANADETAHCMPHRFKHAADFAVAAF
jgi:hypothetical protein